MGVDDRKWWHDSWWNVVSKSDYNQKHRDNYESRCEIISSLLFNVFFRRIIICELYWRLVIAISEIYHRLTFRWQWLHFTLWKWWGCSKYSTQIWIGIGFNQWATNNVRCFSLFGGSDNEISPERSFALWPLVGWAYCKTTLGRSTAQRC